MNLDELLNCSAYIRDRVISITNDFTAPTSARVDCEQDSGIKLCEATWSVDESIRDSRMKYERGFKSLTTMNVG